MKRYLPSYLRSLILSGMLVMMSLHSYASHIIASELRYRYIPNTCDSYQVIMFLYGDCNAASFGAFIGLPVSTPQVCLYDGATLVASYFLNSPSPQCGVEVTPVCPDSLAYTTCTSTSYPISGIKKFSFSLDIKVPYKSANWKFVYTSNNGTAGGTYTCGGSLSGTTGSGPVSSGRSADITNIVAGSSVQLIASLNNSFTNPRGHNSSPVLTVEPTPFYCDSNTNCYNPGAIDIYDVSAAEPSGDSLLFQLVNATNGTGGCGVIGGSVSYLAGYSGAAPLEVSYPITFDPTTGQLCFFTNISQRAVVDYQISEYINDTLGVMTTYAGNGVAGFAGDGGPATAAGAEMNKPSGIAMDAGGNVYFSDYNNNRIRKINGFSGVVTTIAGNGVAGYTGDGFAATSAELNHPIGIALDAAGDVFVADFGNNVVREISTAGVITTVAGSVMAGFLGNGTDAASGIINTIAGNGITGYIGDGGPAAASEVNKPTGFTMDPAGNIYFCDYANHAIRMITMPAGTISTIAGTGIAGYTGDGGPAIAAKISGPMGIALDASGNIIFAEYDSSVVRKISTTGIITTIAGNGTPGFAGDGGLANATTCELWHPTGVAVDPSNNIYISDMSNNRVREIDGTGNISTIAGTGLAGYTGEGVATTVQFNQPYGLTINNAGTNLYVADAQNNRVRQIVLATGITSTFAGTGIGGFSGNNGFANAVQLNNPTGVYMDVAGNMFIADRGNNRIRQVNTSNYLTTLTGTGLATYGGDGGAPVLAKINNAAFVYEDNTGHIYITDYANNRVREITPSQLKKPVAVAVDAANNVYISDTGNEVIRKVTATTGFIDTIAGTHGSAGFAGDGASALSAKINNPFGIYVDGSSNIYFADAGNNRIRMITPGGIISTVVGNTGTAGFGGDGGLANAPGCFLNHPTDIFINNQGYLFISDQMNNRIRFVDSCNYINTIDGDGVPGYTGDGGLPTSAELNNNLFVITDPKENVYITDLNNNRIREVVRNANINKTLVGTMEREMNFLTEVCHYTDPNSLIDTGIGGGITKIDSSHYYGCANSGNFILYTNPREADTSLTISVTATGLVAGFTFGVANDNTNQPHDSIIGNTNIIVPGTYTFYITYTDNHCPLTGTNTDAFTVEILPVPTIRDSIISQANCTQLAKFMIIPGGTGKPWTIRVSNILPDTSAYQIFYNDTSAFMDSLRPGKHILTIFTDVSTDCAQMDTILLDTAKFAITSTFVNPTYCGANNGYIVLSGLTPGDVDSVRYNYDGVWQPAVGNLISPTGTDTIRNLLAGDYDSISVQQGLCQSDSIPDTLVNPPFVFRSVTTKGISQCGYCDGVDSIFGLHPGQLDTITYTLTPWPWVSGTSANVSVVNSVGSDSTVVISGLCAGIYTNFVVNTAGVCKDSLPGPYNIDTLKLYPFYSDTVHYGCHGDTVHFYNFSAPSGELTYNWIFGDGGSAFNVSPVHEYLNTNDNTVTIKLFITNSKCVDSFITTQTFNNVIQAGFSFTPDPFVCQDSLVVFTNTSSGTNPTYTWLFGDGTTSTLMNPTHAFANEGQYNVTLVANENMIPIPEYYTPCYDTMVLPITVDSNSTISINTTDSVICQGQGITFTGIYANSGDTMVQWSFGDGSGIYNVNPILHSYDDSGAFLINLNVSYRACRSQSAMHTVHVFGYPGIYLGPDQSMCPGSTPIMLVDDRNQNNPYATWLWNTGATTPGITVIQPGTYVNVVTINGCSSADTVNILKDCYMDIPNVFTPNNDGTNDYFYPRQVLTKGLATFKMDIYNRWGQLIFETNSIDGKGWDGSFNNQPQPEGVYVYIIDAIFIDGQNEHHTGNVTLLR